MENPCAAGWGLLWGWSTNGGMLSQLEACLRVGVRMGWGQSTQLTFPLCADEAGGVPGEHGPRGAGGREGLNPGAEGGPDTRGRARRARVGALQVKLQLSGLALPCPGFHPLLWHSRGSPAPTECHCPLSHGPALGDSPAVGTWQQPSVVVQRWGCVCSKGHWELRTRTQPVLREKPRTFTSP